MVREESLRGVTSNPSIFEKAILGSSDYDEELEAVSREPMLEHAPDLHACAEECRAEGFTDAVLLGMGGSSLGPEAIRRAFGDIPGRLTLHVLDTSLASSSSSPTPGARSSARLATAACAAASWALTSAAATRSCRTSVSFPPPSWG